MPRAPNEAQEKAAAMYREGTKLKDIAAKLGVSSGTVRSWKNRNGWDSKTLQKKGKNVAMKKCNVATKKKDTEKNKKGGQPGNKNATHSAGVTRNIHNKNAEKHGLFSKWLPDETAELCEEIAGLEPIDILWQNIKIQFAAIIRAQKIMYVSDAEDKTVEEIEDTKEKTKYEIFQAFEKEESFLNAQSRAMDALRNLIKQYEDILANNSALATEERLARIEGIKAQTARTAAETIKVEAENRDRAGEGKTIDDGFIEALNATAAEDWAEGDPDGQGE